MTVTAYAGRAWTSPTLLMAVLTVAGALGLLFVAVVAVKNGSPDMSVGGLSRS